MDFRENAPFCVAPFTRPRPVSVEVSEFRFAKRPYLRIKRVAGWLLGNTYVLRIESNTLY